MRTLQLHFLFRRRPWQQLRLPTRWTFSMLQKTQLSMLQKSKLYEQVRCPLSTVSILIVWQHLTTCTCRWKDIWTPWCSTWAWELHSVMAGTQPGSTLWGVRFIQVVCRREGWTRAGCVSRSLANCKAQVPVAISSWQPGLFYVYSCVHSFACSHVCVHDLSRVYIGLHVYICVVRGTFVFTCTHIRVLTLL